MYPQFRSAFTQVLAVSAKNLLILGYGMTIGFPTILIPQVSDERNPNPGDTEELRLTREQISWISSINLLTVPLGCLLSGWVSQPVGRKRSMMCLNLPLLGAWLLYNKASSVELLYLALSLTGLVGGLLEAPVLTYVAEITQPSLRGLLSATSSMCVILGVFIQFLLGSLYSWRSVALLNTSVPLLALLAISRVPESPHWLIGKGRIVEATKSLCWLRGWTEEREVAAELKSIQDSLSTADVTSSSCCNSWRPYLRRSFLLPYLLIVYLFFIGHFGGMTTIQTFAVGIFKEVGTPLDEYTATVILGLVQLVGSLFCVCIVKFSGRRKLAVSTISLSGLAYLAVGLGTFFAPGFGHLFLLGLLSGSFFANCGIRLFPWMLIGEVYPAEVRGTASGLSGGIGYLLGFAANKSYLYFHSWLGLPGTLMMYGGVSCLGAIGCLLCLPETEGKTLAEVGRCFLKENQHEESKL